MAATIKIGNVMSNETGEKKLAFLQEAFKYSFLDLNFGLAPIGGSFDVLATSTYPHLPQVASDAGQTEEEYVRDSILQTLVNLPNLHSAIS